MASSPEAQAMIEFLSSEIVRDPAVAIGEDTPLVSSGLIDSFALIQVLLELQKVTGRSISPGKVGAKDMDTVSLMLATAERVGVRR